MSLIDHLELTTTDTTKQDALNRFKELGIPTNRNEEWKFTNFNKILKEDFHQVNSSLTNQEVEEILDVDIDENKVVLVNGTFIENLSNITDSTLTVKSLVRAFEENVDLVNQYYSKICKAEADAFLSLNQALNSLLIND